MTEEEYVDKSVRMALRVVNHDLKTNGCIPGAECETIEALRDVLDRNNVYYQEADEPEDVWFDKLLAFQRINGFQNLGVYFRVRCGSSSDNDDDTAATFPDWNFVALTLRSSYEGIIFLRLHLNDEVINGSGDLLRKRREESVTLAKAVITHLTRLQQDILAYTSVKKLTKVLAAIKDVYLEYAMSNDDAMAEYFVFLREMIIKLFSAASISHNQFGLDTLHSLIQSIYGTKPIPKAYTVRGAGFEMINGTYSLSPTITNNGGFVIPGANPRYETVHDVTGKKFVLMVSSVAEGRTESLAEDDREDNTIPPCDYTDYWSLSEEHEENTIPYVYTDYYVAVADDGKNPKTPCLSGWTFVDEVDDPPPKLEALSDTVQVSEKLQNLKEDLALWFLQNNVINYVLDMEGSAATDATSVSMLVEAFDAYFEDSRVCLTSDMSNLMATVLPQLRNSAVKSTQSSTINDAGIEAAKQRLASAKRWQQNAGKMLVDAQTEHNSSTAELEAARAAVRELEVLLKSTGAEVPTAAAKSKSRRRGSIISQKVVDESLSATSHRGGRNRRRSLVDMSGTEFPLK